MRWLVPALTLALGMASGSVAEEKKAEAAEPQEDPRIAAAKKLLTQYLDLVKKKRWAEALKLVHPKTLDVIKDMKKRNKEARHHLSPADAERCCYFIKDYTLDVAENAVNGTVVIGVKENNWQVEEKGITENEPASYLLGQYKGKWWVVDKLQNDTFNEDGIKIGHKGYFDDEGRKPEPKKDEEGE